MVIAPADRLAALTSALTFTLACAVGTCAVACGPWLPSPERADHAGEEPVRVASVPPPPKIEVVPERPADPPETVWIDGEWLWRGRRWEWKQGRWEVPPRGAAHAPPAIVYLEDDKIGWFPGRWRTPATTTSAATGPREAR